MRYLIPAVKDAFIRSVDLDAQPDGSPQVWEGMETDMQIDILTLFPESVDAMLNVSILGRAQERGYIAIRTHQIRALHHQQADAGGRLPLRRRPWAP